MTTKTMTQAAYARHRGISPARVSILIRDGKIPPECYETMANGRRHINVKKADKALSENLDQIYNRRKPQEGEVRMDFLQNWPGPDLDPDLDGWEP